MSETQIEPNPKSESNPTKDAAELAMEIQAMLTKSDLDVFGAIGVLNAVAYRINSLATGK